MKPIPLIASDANISLAWGRAFLLSLNSTGNLPPMVVNIGGFNGNVVENPTIRQAVDVALANHGLESVGNTSSTIFPFRIWCRRGIPRDSFFKWYEDILYPRIRKRRRANQYGVYFYRMIHFVGSKDNPPGGQVLSINQLEYVISCFRRARARGLGIRNSALQVACFDPLKDDTGQPLRGFPCLQQVGFTYNGDDLSVHAFYPTEFIVDRGYGNYLGLCHLGIFMAEQMGLNFAQLYCYIGRPILGSIIKSELTALVSVVREVLRASEEAAGKPDTIIEPPLATECGSSPSLKPAGNRL
ncbi:MAG: hypothetical protein NTV15_01150 [Candidatus Bathyarchaeota archaeon]|nr:hypothetical protein [Candidatus Bathyarchaeota archaeon]